MIYFILLLVITEWLVHSMLSQDFVEYRLTYYRLIINQTITKDDTSWYFMEAEVLYYPSSGKFYMDNGAVLGWFLTWLHPYSIYWIIKYKLHIKKLKNDIKSGG